MPHARCFVAALVLAPFLASAPINAATIRVPVDHSTIQRAIDHSASGDTILVAPGTYSENLTLRAGRHLLSQAGPGQTTINGCKVDAVISVAGDATPTEIVGFTIQGGFASSGGGIWVSGGRVRIAGNVLRSNHAYDQGGALHANYAHLQVTDNFIVENSAGEGAGIYLNASDGVIERNRFQNNWSTMGGALCLQSASPEIRFNLFKYNLAGSGGALCLTGESFPVIENNTILANSATRGGGIFAGGTRGGARINNNIIAASPSGWGIYEVQAAVGGALINCNDLLGNEPADYYEVAPGPHAISADPGFCDPNARDHRLSADSPCASARQPDCGLIGAFEAGCDHAAGVSPAPRGMKPLSP